ncbi:RagB/SusD family nutrient uptake outer membrane protein [Thermoflavifilum thermophilum]|uniref:Starch-binding associating with outer membrane n=1 Tax=Thermoflavifilum thermophilum TaxID=1393122 RepID=A0A1I7MXD8_9BACT|nr:RagB/SusD family nutrient uptake outer membrane protein [Thermoflavifilum thermophilum]SFV27044.1 Starch-binding associating with outer membrane [Thermoflavifilum thermophilum]
MKSKQWIIITTSLLVVATSWSCNESKLNVEPFGATEQDYFSTQDEFQKAVYGVYAKLSDLYNYNALNFATPVWYLPGDDITTSQSNAYEIFGSIQPSDGTLNYFYTACYQLIARANVVLEKIREVKPGIYQDENLKKYNYGEALFLRALMYYYLWNVFGTAPLDTVRVTTTDQIYPPSSKGTELLDQAIQDLGEAAALLPKQWDAANRGRATANAAYGLLGKCLVFRATVNKSTADFQAAIQAFDKIDESVTHLVPNFADNFSPNAENNAESLFEFQASQPYGFDNVWLPNDFDNPVGSMSAYWGFYSNSFAQFGNAPWIATNKLLYAFDPGDPRLPLTIDTTKGDVFNHRAILKYVNPDKLTQSGVGSANNPRILRYADVLLLKAEAILQSGGSTKDAIDLINEVRTRARNMSNTGQPANYNDLITDKNQIMQWIMNERLIELAGEGQRWWDLRRWALGGIITLNNAYFSSAIPDAMSFQSPKHLNFPIPSSEVDVNPNIVQNPGY